MDRVSHEVLEHAEKRLLHDIFGVLPLAGRWHREGVQSLVMAIYDRLERRKVSPPRSVEQREVVRRVGVGHVIHLRCPCYLWVW